MHDALQITDKPPVQKAVSDLGEWYKAAAIGCNILCNDCTSPYPDALCTHQISPHGSNFLSRFFVRLDTQWSRPIQYFSQISNFATTILTKPSFITIAIIWSLCQIKFYFLTNPLTALRRITVVLIDFFRYSTINVTEVLATARIFTAVVLALRNSLVVAEFSDNSVEITGVVVVFRN